MGKRGKSISCYLMITVMLTTSFMQTAFAMGAEVNEDLVGLEHEKLEEDTAVLVADEAEDEETVEVVEELETEPQELGLTAVALMEELDAEYTAGDEVFLEVFVESAEYQAAVVELVDPQGVSVFIAAEDLEGTDSVYGFRYELPQDADPGIWTFTELVVSMEDEDATALLQVEFSVNEVEQTEPPTEAEQQLEVNAAPEVLESAVEGVENATVELPKPVFGNIQAKATSPTKLVISWDKVEGIEQYGLYWSRDGKNFSEIALLNSKQISYTKSNVEPNRTYYVKLQSLKRTEEMASKVVKVTPTFLTPKGMKATANSVSSVKLSWKKSTGAKGYQIYRALGSGAFKKIATTDKLNYTDKKVAKGKKYRYKVRAYLYVNNSGIGANQLICTPYSTIVKATTTPKAPTSVVAKTSGCNSIKLTWKKPSQASGYFVYRATSKGGKYKKIATVKGGSKLSYTDTKLKTGKRYYYKVKTYVAISKKNMVSAGSVITSTKPLPKKVGILKATKVKEGKSTVTWKKAAGVSGYEIYRATKKNGTYKKVATINNGSTVKKTFSNLSKRSPHYFKVRAYKTVSGKKLYGTFSAVVTAEGEYVLRGTNAQAFALEVFDLVNAERKKAGIPALKWDNKLFTAAEVRAAESSIYFSHQRPNGKSWMTITDKAWAENLAMSSGATPKSIVKQWMDSPGHRANIMDRSHTTVGTGVYQTPVTYRFSDGYTFTVQVTYATQLFGIDKTNDGRNAKAKDKKDKFVIEVAKGIPNWD